MKMVYQKTKTDSLGDLWYHNVLYSLYACLTKDIIRLHDGEGDNAQI